MKSLKRNRGLATYLSWIFKILAGLYALGAGIGWWSTARTGTDILMISGAILAPFLPIDVSKIRQSTMKQEEEKPNGI